MDTGKPDPTTQIHIWRKQMAKKLFTDEQVEQFKNNPYTFNVTKSQISFTIEAKTIFWKEYNEGIPIKMVLQNHGYSPEILGDNRIEGILKILKAQSKSKYGFTQGVYKRTISDIDDTLPLDQQVHLLKGEVSFLKSQIEFLKKIFSVKTTKI